MNRLQVLENYTDQMVSIVDSKIQSSKHTILNIQNQQNQYFQQVRESNENLK